MGRQHEKHSRYRSSVGTGERARPTLATTIAPETDRRLRAHSARTGIPIGKILDRAVEMYLAKVQADRTEDDNGQ